MMETPLAMLNAREIAGAAVDVENRLAAFVMGTNDLAKETRARITPGRFAMLPWLMGCIAAARAFGLDILDGVFNDLADAEGFARECSEARDMGFDGKTLIHPRQIEPCNAAFSPSEGEVAQAKKIIAAFDLPENRDKGVVQLEGRMVERLHADMARRTVAIHAAIELLADRSPDVWLDKVRKVDPSYGEAYARVAHYLELNYRFEDAIVYDRKAIEADPSLWSARSNLGIGLMRLGQEDEPRQQLEMCYNNGYRDAATVNSLRLLDSYKDFVTYKENGTILRLRKSEAELLHPYFAAELQRIIPTYEKKYKMKLNGPIQVEVYPDHEDFAVRTMGMPGLGALGVTFGQVVAMDSPSARKPGDFNWGSTLWHEMSHVYILTATGGRVPRWFTEGLAVHEETQVSPEWGDPVSPDILVAIRDKKLLPVAKLDRGFIFPDYPAQVVVSYFEAGSMCDYIKSHWSEEKLLDMVHSYAQRKTTPQVIQADLGVSPEEFDKQYLQWIDQRYGTMAANFDQWRKALVQLAEADKQKQYDTVLQQGEAVRGMYPQYIGDANAYQFVAAANLARGDKKGAVDILTYYEKMGGEDPSILKKLASLEEELGQPKEAAATLDRINYIYPVHDEDLHRHLGDLWFAQANYPGAIREYTAVVALNPLDKAGAYFHLAEAYNASGQRDKAEENVLASLEAAPGYRPAQKLLLDLQKDAPKPN